MMIKLKNWTVSKISWTSYWKVEKPFFWLIDYYDKEKWMIIAEDGFITNYGTIPRILRPIFDPTCYNSYVIHDASYAIQMLYSPLFDEYKLMTRKQADLALIEWLAYEWAWFYERLFIYIGVRIGGWMAWNFWEKTRLEREEVYNLYVLGTRKDEADIVRIIHNKYSCYMPTELKGILNVLRIVSGLAFGYLSALALDSIVHLFF